MTTVPHKLQNVLHNITPRIARSYYKQLILNKILLSSNIFTYQIAKTLTLWSSHYKTRWQSRKKLIILVPFLIEQYGCSSYENFITTLSTNTFCSHKCWVCKQTNSRIDCRSNDTRSHRGI